MVTAHATPGVRFEPADFAAEVDRVAYLVLPQLAADPQLADLAAEYDVPPRNLLVPMSVLLATRSMTIDEAGIVFRYRSRDAVEAWLAELVAGDLLFETGIAPRRYWPTQRAAGYLSGLAELQDDKVAELVPHDPAHDQALIAFTAFVAELHARNVGDRPGFSLVCRGPFDGRTPAARLVRLAAAFRHLRADAHAAALQAAGVHLPMAPALDRAWRAEGPVEPDARLTAEALGELVMAGHAVEAGAGAVALTDDARAMRDAVEADTNDRYLTLLGGDVARVGALAQKLAAVRVS